MALHSFIGRGRRRPAVLAVYNRIVEQARSPVFFAEWGVPDTVDGRFEVLALHAFLVLQRLRADRAATAAFAQDLFDTMFADLDRAMREMGATDIGVGRYVKEMARGFYGRSRAYEEGLAGDAATLTSALQRNLYGTAAVAPTAAQLTAVAAYLHYQIAALAAAPVEAVLGGTVAYAPAPAAAPAEPG